MAHFPRVGKSALKFSNDWKNATKSFQWLEKSGKQQSLNFPRVGKVSNDWKTGWKAVVTAG
jgi:hypothetical protein